MTMTSFLTGTAVKTDTYRARFDELAAGGFDGQPEELQRLRREAMDRFEQLGFPTTRMESWRNTSVEPITGTEFRLPVEVGPIDSRAAEPFRLQESFQVVVAGGRFVSGLSLPEGLPQGVELRGLADALNNIPERVLPHLTQYADFQEYAFTALNTAFLSDGVFIHVPDGMQLDRPVHVIYLSTAAIPTPIAVITHPRTLVMAGENSRLTVVEHYAGMAGRPTLTNAVTEIVAGAGSIVDYTRMQQEPDDAYHIATVQAYQEADSRAALHTVTVGGGLIRNDVNSVLAGEGAEVAMNGLYLVKGRQHVDNHTRIEHAAPHCTSMENYRGILDDRGQGIFNGRIVVHPEAQKTNATQSNQNLMLSDNALVNTNPQLEIYADDVKCTHGSTVGQIDEEVVFYFLARGIDRRTARKLLIHGFTQEIISLIEDDIVRKSVNRIVSRWLPDGQVPLKAE